MYADVAYMHRSRVCLATRDDLVTKCPLDDLLMGLKANKMALNSAVYMEGVDGKCSLREVFPIKAAHPTAFSVF